MKFHLPIVVKLACLGIVIAAYFRWFQGGILSAPDFTFLFPQRLGDFTWLPLAWSEVAGNGLGGSTFHILNLDTYLHFGIRLLVFVFRIPWHIAMRIMFFWPFLFFGLSGAYYFVKSVIKERKLAAIGALVYMTNTYILMIAGGGQVGLMMAYAAAPFVLGSFIRGNTLLFTIVSVVFIIFDIRYAYLLYAALLLYAVIRIPASRWITTARMYMVPVLWIIAANLFWFIPLMLAPSFGLPAGYGDPGWLSYLSWAEFSKTVSLLHPNWPENIFGKTYFMRPEFLLLPFIAMFPLVFTRQEKTHEHGQYRFFVVLALIGAFVAKGVNPPFGQVYEWAFTHLPLFNGFRDPTKFYLLTALSFSVLLPYAVGSIEAVLGKAKKPYAAYVHPGFLVFWVLLLLPFWQGQVHGTFTTVTVSPDYSRFEQLAMSDQGFNRILAVPWRQRFIFQSENHPLINASDVFKTSDPEAIISALTDPSAQQLIRSFSIRYIVIPEDSMGEIFLTDRSYDPKLRERMVNALDTIPYIRRLPEFTGLTVYEYAKPAGHFYRELENSDLERQQEQRVRSTLYTVNINTSNRPVELVFSESFDPSWRLWDGKSYIQSRKTKDGLNSFVIDSDHTSRVSVWYSKELLLVWAYRGTGIALLILLLFSLIRKRRIRNVAGKTVMIVMLAGTMVVVYRFLPQETDVLQSPATRYSSEWVRFTHPVTGEHIVGSRFGGSEVSFRLKNATVLHVEADGINTVPDEQMLELYVGDVVYTLASPFSAKHLDIPVQSKEPVPVTARVICSSAMVPCDVRIRRLSADTGSIVMPPESQEKPVMAILGDSLTSSFGPKNYSYQLAGQLGYRVHNAGIFGSSVSQAAGWDSGVLRVSTDISVFKPDIAIIFMGTNDLAHTVPLDVFRSNYAALLSRIQEESPATRIIAVGLLRRKDFAEQEVRSYSNVIRREAQARNIAYIDPYAWLDYSDFQDVVHPSPESQDKLADKMYQALLPILTR